MLLAAGCGERMEPLSSFIPKPALEVLGEPLAASALRHLAPRCRRLVANLHRHSEAVRLAISRFALANGTEVAFSRETVLLGGAGGVAAARPLLGPGPVLVANTDVWAELDLDPLVAASAEDCAVLALIPHPDPRRWSGVELDPRGGVTGFVARGEGNDKTYLFTGFQLLGEQVVAALPPPPGEFAPVWEELRRRGRLRGVVVSGAWREAGTPLAYLELVLARLGDASWCHAASLVAADARLVRSAVGEGCRVDAGARLTACVVTGGAAVGAGSELRNCLVAGPVAVPAGAHLEHALVLPTGITPLR